MLSVCKARMTREAKDGIAVDVVVKQLGIYAQDLMLESWPTKKI